MVLGAHCALDRVGLVLLRVQQPALGARDAARLRAPADAGGPSGLGSPSVRARARAHRTGQADSVAARRATLVGVLGTPAVRPRRAGPSTGHPRPVPPGPVGSGGGRLVVRHCDLGPSRRRSRPGADRLCPGGHGRRSVDRGGMAPRRRPGDAALRRRAGAPVHRGHGLETRVPRAHPGGRHTRLSARGRARPRFSRRLLRPRTPTIGPDAQSRHTVVGSRPQARTPTGGGRSGPPSLRCGRPRGGDPGLSTGVATWGGSSGWRLRYWPPVPCSSRSWWPIT